MDNRADAAPHVLLRKCFSKGGKIIYIIITSPSLDVCVSWRRGLLAEADWKVWICFSLDLGQHLLGKLKVCVHVCYLFSFFSYGYNKIQFFLKLLSQTTVLFLQIKWFMISVKVSYSRQGNRWKSEFKTWNNIITYCLLVLTSHPSWPPPTPLL